MLRDSRVEIDEMVNVVVKSRMRGIKLKHEIVPCSLSLVLSSVHLIDLVISSEMHPLDLGYAESSRSTCTLCLYMFGISH